MDRALAAPLIPPAPKVHLQPLGGSAFGDLRIALEMGRNLVGAWSEADFDNLIAPYRFMGQPGLVVSADRASEALKPVVGSASLRPSPQETYA